MNIELLLIIACFICLIVLHFRVETRSKALQEMRECNQSLLNVVKLINNDLSEVENNTFKKVKELERNVHIVDEGRIKDHCALKQDIQEIHRAIEYLYGDGVKE